MNKIIALFWRLIDGPMQQVTPISPKQEPQPVELYQYAYNTTPAWGLTGYDDLESGKAMNSAPYVEPLPVVTPPAIIDETKCECCCCTGACVGFYEDES